MPLFGSKKDSKKDKESSSNIKDRYEIREILGT